MNVFIWVAVVPSSWLGLAFAFGVVLGRGIAIADEREQPQAAATADEDPR